VYKVYSLLIVFAILFFYESAFLLDTINMLWETLNPWWMHKFMANSCNHDRISTCHYHSCSVFNIYSPQLTCLRHNSCTSNLARMRIGQSHPSASYWLDAACSINCFVMILSLLCAICRSESVSVSVEVFHFNPRRLTDVSASSVSSACALAYSTELFDSQERRLKCALLMMALAVV